MTSFKAKTCILAFVLLLSLKNPAGAAQNAQTGLKPVSYAEILKMIEQDETKKAILSQVIVKKVDFKLTEYLIAQLTSAWKKVKGDDIDFPPDLLKALQDNYVPPKATLVVRFEMVGVAFSTTVGRGFVTIHHDLLVELVPALFETVSAAVTASWMDVEAVAPLESVMVRLTV
jgi:hypothetical protein